MAGFAHALAQEQDLPRLRALMTRAIEELQRGFLSPEQVAASHQIMGLDTQLVKDRTYFMVLDTDTGEGTLVGCGGWSWRATLFGGDDSIVAREPLPLDPAKDAAKIRAMYVDPAHARRGIGKVIMALCENAARAAGFGKVELMATLAGLPLYKACGYAEIEAVEATSREGVKVPIIRMGKAL